MPGSICFAPLWHDPSLCSPANGPTCRSPSSPRRPAPGASTASSWPAGATTSTSTPPSTDDNYCRERRELLESHGLNVWTIGNHLVGQAVCDRIDARHQGVVPPDVWGDGDPEGVRQRAAEKLKDTARAAARFGVTTVTGFTGSPIWHLLYSFPPNDFDELERGYEEFAERFAPIIDVFDAEGVKFALEVHPTEIAYDFVTTRKTLDALDHREGFGINFDPSHFEHQFLDSAAFVTEFADRIYHVHVKDSIKRLDGRRSILGGAPELRRGGARLGLRLPGHGDVDFEDALPRAEPDRLPGPALDRVGGLRDGPRLGRPGRAGLRPRDRLLSLHGGVRRRLRAFIGSRSPAAPAASDRRWPTASCCGRSRSTWS